MTTKEKLLDADNCIPMYLNRFEEGGAEVFKLNDDIFVLFKIPPYGGVSRYEGTFNISNIDEMIAIIESWTKCTQHQQP